MLSLLVTSYGYVTSLTMACRFKLMGSEASSRILSFRRSTSTVRSTDFSSFRSGHLTDEFQLDGHSSRFRILFAWNRMLYRVLVHSPSFPPLVWTCIPHRKLSSPSTSRFADPPADLFLANALSVGSFDHRKHLNLVSCPEKQDLISSMHRQCPVPQPTLVPRQNRTNWFTPSNDQWFLPRVCPFPHPASLPEPYSPLFGNSSAYIVCRLIFGVYNSFKLFNLLFSTSSVLTKATQEGTGWIRYLYLGTP